jgi:hypothetical protein
MLKRRKIASIFFFFWLFLYLAVYSKTQNGLAIVCFGVR